MIIFCCDKFAIGSNMTKLSLLALINALGAFAAMTNAARASAVEPTHAPILTVKTVRPKLFYAWADLPRDYRLRIVVPPPFALARLSQSVSCRGVAMTGGYTQRGHNVPDGLIVLGGRVVGKNNDRQDGGLLEVRAGKVSLRRAAGHGSSRRPRPIKSIRSQS